MRGPAFVKVGDARTSPIRYRLSSVIAWMQSFQERDSTVMHREAGPWPASLVFALEHGDADQPGAFPGVGPNSKATTFDAWLNSADNTDVWPMVDTHLGPMNAFTVMGFNYMPVLDGVRWMSLEEWRETVGWR